MSGQTPSGQGPVILEIDDTRLPDTPSPAAAPQPVEPEVSASARVISAAGQPRGFGMGQWLLTALGALIGLWICVAISDFVAGLLARHSWLGWIALALAILTALILLAIILREIAALSRLRRIEGVRERALEAIETGSEQAGRAALTELARLYRGRAELEWARDRLRAASDDTPDTTGRLEIAERELMRPLDRRAEAAVSRASRDVAAATALIPMALFDVLAALAINLRMVREIAQIYGGRAGWLGSWRLMRRVAAHLIATGAIAVADDLLGPMVGGGVLAKLSRRFGEGALNGALTARVGVTAIEVCRPLPFTALDRPSASAIVLNALRGWRRTGEQDVAADNNTP